MNIYIYEKNMDQRIYLQAIIQEIILDENLDMYIVHVTGDYGDLLKEIAGKSHKNLYILGTDTEEQNNCIFVGEEIRSRDDEGYMILISNDAQTSYLSFKHRLHVSESILEEEQERVVHRLRETLIKIYRQERSRNFTLVQGKYSKKTIPYESIIAFKSSSRSHCVEIQLDGEVVTFRGALGQILSQLDQRFVRCHRSLIVNINKVTELNKKANCIKVNNNTEFKVSIEGCKKLKQKLCIR